MKEIIIGQIYKVKNNPYWFKPIEILKPKEKENTNNYTVVRGEFSTTKNNFSFAIIKHFKPSELIKCIHEHKHYSDCSINNEPAFKKGKCDCKQ